MTCLELLDLYQRMATPAAEKTSWIRSLSIYNSSISFVYVSILSICSAIWVLVRNKKQPWPTRRHPFEFNVSFHYYQNWARDLGKKKYLHREETAPFPIWPGSQTRPSPELSKIRSRDPIFFCFSGLYDAGQGSPMVRGAPLVFILKWGEVVRHPANFLACRDYPPRSSP